MPTEFGAKVLDIDPAKVTQVIIARGGSQVGPAVLVRRYVYDIAAGDRTRWLRLHDTGSGSTLTVKEIRHDGIDGTDETEVGVEQFEAANDLRGKLGFRLRGYRENRRGSFVPDGARLEIDEWPLIPPYLEIEADSRREVLRVAALLGYQETDLTGENAVSVYAHHGVDQPALERVSFDGR